MTIDPYGAFVREVDVAVAGVADGPLSGLTFGAKDLFDVEGFVTGAGSPEWRESHGPAAKNAAAVQMLLDAGASLAGKTQTDEMAFSLNGENSHYGTPTNPAAPERIPGGSSSGSAVSVASALVDFSIGTDTGGSVRIPASYCGIYGIRPTHGAVPIEGVVPLAPSLDTVGWFARSADMLRRVGSVLLPPAGTPRPPSRIVVLSDAFRITEEETGEVVRRKLDAMAERLPPMEEVTLPLALFDEWLIHFESAQFYEVWQSHGDWITRENPALGPGIKERFERCAEMPIGAYSAAQRFRERAREAMAGVVPQGTIMVLPTSPAPPLHLNLSPEVAAEARAQRLKLLCLAGLCGMPQVSVPAGQVGGAPVGLSFVAAPGEDRNLLAFVTWQKQALERS